MKRYFSPLENRGKGGEIEDESKYSPKRKEVTGLKTKTEHLEDADEFTVEDSPFEEIVVKADLRPRKGQRKRHKTLYRVPVPIEKLIKHSRGEKVDVKGIRGKVNQRRLEHKEQLYDFSTEQAARSELLLTEDSGYLVADEGEDTANIKQSEIVKEVDITSATKHFDLRLYQYAPYRMDYTRNGRGLLLGGRKGHLAAMDWVTKKLSCEINVMESIHDVRWLHNDKMYAVAQKGWTYIYDDQGIELHCLKKLYRITRLDFLPYHFLLVACSDQGFMSWLDVSIGQIVAQFPLRQGRLSIMAQNPQNALMCLGHTTGGVTMWSPNSREPLVKMQCHHCPLSALAVHPSGNYLATASTDRSIGIWDLRNMSQIHKYRMRYAPSELAFSQKGMLAAGFGNIVEVFKDCVTKTVSKPYMRHWPRGILSQLQFCPFEDVLGVCTGDGFESLLIPGSAEANFDALEANPFQSKKQRQEVEVKALLEKIPPELITLNPNAIAEVDVPTLKEKIEAKQKLKFVKPPKIDWERKRKGKGGPSAVVKTKRRLQEQSDKEFRQKVKEIEGKLSDEEGIKEEGVKEEEPAAPPHVLDRFKPKKKKK